MPGLSADAAERVLASVDEEALLSLLSGMVRFPSQIPNEGPLSDWLGSHVRALGCFDEVLVWPVVSGRSNVIAILRGTGEGRNILLNGHLDIPGVYGDWTRDPYEPTVEDGWIYGLGLSDMKAGVACQLMAAVAIARAGIKLRGDVIVSAVIHHDTCGLGTKFFLDSWDDPIHAAINGEPTDLKLQVAHGGAWQFEIAVEGRAAHTSRVEDGIDAIAKMMKILARLELSDLTRGSGEPIPGLPRIVIGQIEGGASPSRTAERCTVRGDIRLTPGMTARSLTQDLERVIKEIAASDPELRATVQGLVYQRPFRVDPQGEVVQLVATAHEQVTGQSPTVTDGLPVSAFVTDSSDLQRAGIETVVYGPTEWRTVPDERVRVADLLVAAKTYALAAARFAS